ncbi:MAG: DUF1772 domain-containing protein [Acidimicrobiia bacterium]
MSTDGLATVSLVAATVSMGLIAYVVVIAITVAVHVPLNDAIKGAQIDGPQADLTEVRAHFHEARWAAWNLVRAVTSTGAFAALAWALVLHGRATA